MNKKYLLIPVALLIIGATTAQADAFSFQGLLQSLHLTRATTTRPVGQNRATSTMPWVRGEGRNSSSTMPFFGTVSSVSDASVVLKLDLPNSMPGLKGRFFRASTTPVVAKTLTVALTADTTYIGGTKANLVVGAKVSGQAKVNTDKSLSAVRIHINPAKDGTNRPEDRGAKKGDDQGNRLHRGLPGLPNKGSQN